MDNDLKLYAGKIAAEWGSVHSRGEAWVLFTSKRLAPPRVPPPDVNPSREQMFSWLAESLSKFGELNAITVLEAAQEDESVEPYVDADFNDLTAGSQRSNRQAEHVVECSRVVASPPPFPAHLSHLVPHWLDQLGLVPL